MVIRVVLLLMFISSSAFAQDPWEKIYKDTKMSIPIVYSSGGICSGALIEKNLVLTAWHCIATLRSTFVVWDKDDKMPLQSQVVAMDRDVDLALVRLPIPSAHKTLKLVADNSTLAEGQEIATIGHPLAAKQYGVDPDKIRLTPSLSHIMSKGIISKVADDVVVTDTSFSPGNSGGPVLNKNGDIVGVVSRKRVGMGIGAIGYAVSPSRVQKFLKKYKTGLVRMPHPAEARSSFNASYEIGYHGFIDDFTNGDDLFFNTIKLTYDLAGRLRFYYERSIEKNPDLWSYGMGWVSETPVKKDQVVHFIPHVGQIRYRGDGLNVDPETFVGLTIGMPTAAFYMDYRYVFNDGGNSIFSLGFLLF